MRAKRFIDIAGLLVLPALLGLGVWRNNPTMDTLLNDPGQPCGVSQSTTPETIVPRTLEVELRWYVR